MKKSNGLLSGRSRNLTRHHKPSQLAIRDLLKSFNIGDRVAIVPKGNNRDIPHPRFKGKVGIVLGKRGSAYIVDVKDVKAHKQLIVSSKHLEKVSL
ncbi:50S ribosomal protein L21e [mine drainage metagenome]|uniref:Large ribosomal subunit protein eL21 n=1 Tax=mine drainage metagenome TaxID=410659 RepID=T0YTD5_9ZZZZ